MHNKATISIKNAAQIIEGASDVEIRNINMPVFMGFAGAFKTISLC
jgi:hypothetical protein